MFVVLAFLPVLIALATIATVVIADVLPPSREKVEARASLEGLTPSYKSA